MKILILFLAIILGNVSYGHIPYLDGSMKTWKTNTDQVYQGEFMRMEKNQVLILGSEYNIVSLPLKELSSKDRAYVANELGAATLKDVYEENQEGAVQGLIISVGLLVMLFVVGIGLIIKRQIQYAKQRV